MDGQPTRPGKGLYVSGDAAVPVELPLVDDATVPLVYRNLFIGGEPGSGKSSLLNLLAVYAALFSDDPLPVGDDPKEGGRRDADPGR